MPRRGPAGVLKAEQQFVLQAILGRFVGLTIGIACQLGHILLNMKDMQVRRGAQAL